MTNTNGRLISLFGTLDLSRRAFLRGASAIAFSHRHRKLSAAREPREIQWWSLADSALVSSNGGDYPFLNCMKTGSGWSLWLARTRTRPWIRAYLNSDGYPIIVPAGGGGLHSI